MLGKFQSKHLKVRSHLGDLSAQEERHQHFLNEVCERLMD